LSASHSTSFGAKIIASLAKLGTSICACFLW
jgi:hypothetical protein